jgi:hypothetical protein
MKKYHRRGISCREQKEGRMADELVTSCVGTVVGGRIEVRVRRGRRSKQLLDDLNEARIYWT